MCVSIYRHTHTHIYNIYIYIHIQYIYIYTYTIYIYIYTHIYIYGSAFIYAHVGPCANVCVHIQGKVMCGFYRSLVVPEQSLQECEDGPSGSGECSCMAGAEAGQRCSDAKLIDIWLSKYSDSTSKHGRSYIILFDLVFEWLMMGELISFCVVLMGLVWVSGLTNKFGDVNRYAAITCNGMKWRQFKQECNRRELRKYPALPR